MVIVADPRRICCWRSSGKSFPESDLVELLMGTVDTQSRQASQSRIKKNILIFLLNVGFKHEVDIGKKFLIFETMVK